MIPDESDRRRLTGGIALLATGLLAVALVAPLAVAPALAGDNAAIVYAEPETVAAEPGEEFEIDVVLRSHGGYNDVGVEQVVFRAAYHPAYLEVTDVEPGGWLEQGSDTGIETATTTAHDRGVAALAQRRDPPAGGAAGIDTLATLTVRVPEDAPAANATLAFHHTRVNLTNDYPQPVHERNATVVIDGGGEQPEPFDHGDIGTIGVEGATETASDDATADDGTETTAGAETAENDDEGNADGDAGDAIPGFTPVATLVAVVVALAARTTDRGR